MTSRVVKFLEGLLRLHRATESLLIDVVASYAPWVAPVVPALMTWQNMVNRLGFPEWAAWAAAICVETLGLSSVQTVVSFWQWNDGKHKSEQAAPVFIAMLAGGFYLATVLTVNAMLDDAPAVYRLAKGLLSSLSVCAGVILALRAGHAQRIAASEAAREERRQERRERRERAANPLPLAPIVELQTAGGNGRHGTQGAASIR